MRWNIEGADGNTGEEHVYTFDADTREEAEQKARAKGILVSAVHRATVQPRDEQGVTVRSRAGVVAPAPAASPDAPPLPYRAPTTSVAHAPDYFGLRFGAEVLLIFAVLYYIAAVIALAGAVLTLASGASQSRFAAGTVGALGLTLAALSLAMLGGLLHALSAACVALRDIARNSFR